MRHSKIPILSTRPLNDELVSLADQKGFSLDVVPFIKTEQLRSDRLQSRINELSQQSVTAIFTSMNAAEAVIAQLKGVKPLWKIYCIGNTTRRTLERHFGQYAIIDFAGSASDLAQNIVNAGNVSQAVFFCGDQRREELPNILSGHEIRVEEIIVYRTISLQNKIEQLYHGILFFSPSAVTSFFSNNVPDKKTILFAIGETTASEIRRHTDNLVVVSVDPGKDKLVNTMIEFYHLQSDQLPGGN